MSVQPSPYRSFFALPRYISFENAQGHENAAPFPAPSVNFGQRPVGKIFCFVCVLYVPVFALAYGYDFVRRTDWAVLTHFLLLALDIVGYTAGAPRQINNMFCAKNRVKCA
ncbi:unnamed protein product [Ectocarpus sp. 12 AP-2014]